MEKGNLVTLGHGVCERYRSFVVDPIFYLEVIFYYKNNYKDVQYDLVTQKIGTCTGSDFISLL